jgi:DNA-directed RNA polymerase specialized sigma24 family protein
MLGSVAEAEDIVQAGLLRLHRALEQGERISSPRAYLATVTSASRWTSCARRGRTRAVAATCMVASAAGAINDPASLNLNCGPPLRVAFLLLGR